MKTATEQTQQERILRHAIRTIKPRQAQAIRDAYFKAVEGLNALAEALEFADLENGEDNDHTLLNEHLLACDALETMNQSLLGRIV